MKLPLEIEIIKLFNSFHALSELLFVVIINTNYGIVTFKKDKNLPIFMRRVALAQAPYSEVVFGREKNAKGANPPLGLYSLKAYNNNIADIRVFDGETYDSFNNFIGDIEDFQPELIGITTVSHSYERSKDLARYFTEKALTVAGGPYATFRDQECLEDFDVVVRGEGEQTLRELIRRVPFQKINGISYIDNGKFVRNLDRTRLENLDEIPLIEWGDQEFFNYSRPSVFDNRSKTGYIITSRGCAYNCGYCCSNIMWDRIRLRNPENVAKEIARLNENYGIDYLKFWDDTFTLRSNSNLIPILNELKSRGIRFTCNARADTISEKKLAQLADAGCDKIFYGCESSVPEIRKELGRKMTNEQLASAFHLTKMFGIHTVGSFIFGSPNEKEYDIEKTIEFAIDIDPDKVLFNILTPHPGTPIYNYAIARGLIDHYKVDTSKWQGEPLGIPTISKHLTREQLQKMKFEAYKRFYGRQEYLINQLKKAQSLDDLVSIQNIVRTYL